jgi:hypothetical protein
MRLTEFYNPESDQQNKIASTDTRKTRLRLKDLRKLRRYRDVKRAEQLEHDKFAKQMYGTPEEDATPDF